MRKFQILEKHRIETENGKLFSPINLYISRSNQDDGAGNISQFKSQPETPQYQTIQPFPQSTCEYTEKKN